jgi:hypothetical protein
MGKKKISQLSNAATLDGTEYIPMVQNGATVKAPAGNVAALGGASYTDVTGTLAAGSTSLVLSDASITTSSTLDIYTDVYGVNPTAVTVSTGSVTLTFEAQQAAIAVKVRVW